MVLPKIENQGIDPKAFGPKMILRACLFVSLLLHLGFALVFQKAFPYQWTGEELRAYRVELIRPPVDDVDLESLSEAEMAQLRHEKREAEEKNQETISLDTDDVRYISYARMIKGKIMHQWRYPQKAKEQLLEGRLLALFSLGRDGRMIRIKVLHPSGFETLDDEAVRAISTAAPFPPFPEHIEVNRLNIKASFDYRLTSKR
jgi:TonB family protein